MKVGDLREFKTTIVSNLKGRVFFITRTIEDEGFEIILLDNGERWILSYFELRYYTEIIKTDKKCP